LEEGVFINYWVFYAMGLNRSKENSDFNGQNYRSLS
jgi:hypothetical protein